MEALRNVTVEVEGPYRKLEEPLSAAEGAQTGPLREAHRWKWVSALLVLVLCGTAALLLITHFQLKLRHLAGSDKAAIHLVGNYRKEVLNSSIMWSSNSDQAFAQGGLKLEGNEIVIPRHGLYFVYSQASFRLACSSGAKQGGKAGELVHVSHALDRWSDSYGGRYRALLATTQSACKIAENDGKSGKNWYSGIYLGAVFELDEGDRLRSNNNEKTLPSLTSENGKTFFGAFAL
ncbi:hypothetical protein JZ751_015035 [Albula glossodonta]|uniref:Lymphotoxin-alpha n=1 Tax=Albula glossodonta TaxID=121402 RepID=A0A8T2MV03_9TELE|nr:hypothetical protein JZ751_015035 [Albula glossodonta]